ncbi:MAG: FecR domain-containing protein [Acidobacteriota bacterium]|nr:FecR domain-containing protein [Acidobacteriota bacterium]
MKNKTSIVSLMLAVFFACLQVTALAGGQALSHVRIVRLSFVDGTVLVRRPGATEWAKASVNTPIEQGFSLSTSDNSFAEVEFENGSTARIGQLSQLDFTELAATEKGAKINQLTLDRGYGTFNLAEHHGDTYTVAAGATTVEPNGKAEFRTDVTHGNLRVEVFRGSVDAKGPNQETAKITKDKVLNISAQTEDAFNVTHGIQKDAWDTWVHDRDQQATLAYNDSSVGLNAPLYGWSDLDAYGEWGYFPGYGYGWSPFVTAGWSPFSMGQWSFYPGMGYTWISNEPWGWLPFHYGNWNFMPGYGYFWMPGSFNTFSPGVVTWFSGPGYIGWAPMGTGGVPVCTSKAGCVTAVATGTLANGGVVSPTTRVPVNPTQLTRIQGPTVAPGPTAMLSGTALERGVIPAALLARRTLPAGERTPATVHPNVIRSDAAPKIVLMGQSPNQAAKVESLSAHHSIFSHSAERPVTARMGNTLGGSYVISRSMRGASEMTGPRGEMSRQAPVFLSHRSSGPAMAGPRFEMSRGGEVRTQNRGMAAPAMRSYGGGMRASEGVSSVHQSAPAPQMSAGHAASSGGPHR